MRRVLLVAALSVWPSSARAHRTPLSRLDLEFGLDGLKGRWIIHAGDASEKLDGAAQALYDPAAGKNLLPKASRWLDEALDLRADGSPLTLLVSSVEPDLDRQSLIIGFSAAWRKTPESLTVRCRFFPERPDHAVCLTVRRPGAAAGPPIVVGGRDPPLDLRVGVYRSLAAAWVAFVRQGVRHIFIGPDHIAFVLGIILLGGGAWRLAAIVTSFTLAHSVTLALAALDLVRPPSMIIEPAIALSIVFIGVENLRAAPGRPDRRAAIAFGFGLVHGFGFASVLREFGLPRAALGTALFGFNAGVEVGQVCIVLAALPLVARLGTRVRWASYAICAAGSFWFVERVLSGA